VGRSVYVFAGGLTDLASDIAPPGLTVTDVPVRRDRRECPHKPTGL